MKTWYAITFYIMATLVLVACVAIIVVKLLFFAPCTPTVPNGSICTVDGWSIAGLAATVLGVGAAILTILGALAVAYWWAELDKRVNNQVKILFEKEKEALNNNVDELLDAQKATINKEMDGLLIDQQTALNTEVDLMLAKQKVVIDEALQNQLTTLNKKIEELLEVQRKKVEGQEQKLAQLDRELKQIQALALTIIDLSLSIADINPPWQREDWARDITDRLKTTEIPKHMALSYFKVVNEFLTQPANNIIFYTRSLQAQHAPSDQLSYYWNKGLEWEHVIEEYYSGVMGEVILDKDGKLSDLQVPEPLRIVREKVNEYRPGVEEWMKRYPTH